jgi:hypothetical protein
MTYRDTIRELLDEGFIEPQQIARRVIEGMDESEYPDIIHDLMIIAVRDVIRGRRSGTLAQHRRSNPRVHAAPSEPVYVPGTGWVNRVDLTADQCDVVADHYQDLANQNQAKANEYRVLAKSIRESGHLTLGDYLTSNRKKTREGIKRARELGVPLGRPSRITFETEQCIVTMRREGKTLREIADTLNQQGTPTGQGAAEWRPSSVNSVYKRVVAA